MSNSMKKTSVDYIGEINSNFQLGTIGSLFQIKKDIIGHEPDTVLSITQKGIKIKDTTSNNGQNAQSYSKYQIVNQGDFAMNHMDLLTGWIDISQYEGVTSPDYRVFKIKDDSMSSKYFLYLFQSYYQNRTFYGFGQGVANLGRWRLPANNFLGMFMPIPSSKEQKKIADILDKKCSQIDTLIANQQKEIEKLKQYKQSLITEVVIKGLDHNAPMKDSGIEWIGEIPEHYSIIRMRYLIDNYKAGPFGSSLITDQLLNEGNILCYSPEHIANQSTENEKNLYLPEDRRKEMSQFFVNPGDVIFPIVGSLGRAMVITEEMPSGIINQRLAKFTVNTDKINIDYFMWLFAKSSFFKPFIDLYQRGSIIVNLTKTIVYDMPFVIPSTLAEQEKIASYLEYKCSQVERLITIKQTKIDKLNDYKKSIIYEYVTGKKEVE